MALSASTQCHKLCAFLISKSMISKDLRLWNQIKQDEIWSFLFYTIATVYAVVILAHGFDVSDESNVLFSKASCNFTLNLLKEVVKSHNDSNIIFSPASISFLLAVLQQGAKGNTADQLKNLLGLSAEEAKIKYKNLGILKDEKNVTIEWGNRCYIKPGIELNDDFKTGIKEAMDVDVEELNFGVPSSKDSADQINNWIKRVTHNQIMDLVDPTLLTPGTIMVLVNAIFFKGFWLSPFKKGKTAEDKFEVGLTQSVQTFFMSQREKFYSDKDSYLGAKWVHLPFQNKRFAMIFILPTKRHRLNQLIEKLTEEDLDRIFNHRGVSYVKLRIPKFKLSEKVSLVETLKRLGLTDIFSQASDLSGVSSTIGNLQVSEIIHEANVEIDEKGSTGSAATVIQLLRMRTPNLAFIADQPFLFFIADLNAKLILFAGKVINPKV